MTGTASAELREPEGRRNRCYFGLDLGKVPNYLSIIRAHGPWSGPHRDIKCNTLFCRAYPLAWAVFGPGPLKPDGPDIRRCFACDLD